MEVSFDKYINSREEKVLLIMILGILSALKEKSITISEAEKLIFSPYTVSQLKKHLCPPDIVHIIELGCELEDIESIIPEKLEKNIEDLYSKTVMMLKKYNEECSEFWIDIVDEK